MKFVDWFNDGLRKQRATRYEASGIVAHFWDGGAPQEHPVKDLSLTGAYLHATQQWYVGTLLDIALQKAASRGDASADSALSLRCKVVRQGPDGIGIMFILRAQKERRALKHFMEREIENTGPFLALRKRGAAAREGQAIIEYALMVPFLFLFIVNLVNFGGMLYGWVTVANAARAGSQYAAMGSSYASYPIPASLTSIQTLVQNETSALPHSSSSNPTVTVCQNNTLYSGAGNTVTVTDWGSTSACPAGVTAPPSDPETITGAATGSAYTTVTIDVSYTYTPFIPTGFKFPALHIFTLVMPGTIHRRTVMRVLN